MANFKGSTIPVRTAEILKSLYGESVRAHFCIVEDDGAILVENKQTECWIGDKPLNGMSGDPVFPVLFQMDGEWRLYDAICYRDYDHLDMQTPIVENMEPEKYECDGDLCLRWDLIPDQVLASYLKEVDPETII